MTSRESETVEAVLLLTDLKKTPEFIAQQLGISPAAVGGIIRTGQISPTQQSLFPDADEIPKKKPVSRLAPWKQALQK